MRSRPLPILVAVETDPTRYHGEHPTRPEPLDRGGAEQLLAHLASDLSALFRDADRCRLVLSGALYDPAQVLRPGFPVLEALGGLATEAPGERGYRPGLLSIGAHDGRMPDAALQPDPGLPPGVLQLLVLSLSGPDDLVAALDEESEHRFMEEGQLSPHSAKALEAAFGIGVTHARFMTLTDLQAMLRLQLEHFGFLPLWELLQAALDGEAGPVDVVGPQGQRYQWDGNRVRACFESFDHWAGSGAGASLDPATGAQLAEAYGDWTRSWRQYLLTLRAHGVPVRQHLPGRPEHALEGSYYAERTDRAAAGAAAVTEHFTEELGTIAVTVAEDGVLTHYYPIGPEGLNDLHRHIRPQAAAGAVSFPGAILVDAATRSLRADRLEERPAAAS